MDTALCPSCNQRKYSATKNSDGLCDECRGGRQKRRPKSYDVPGAGKVPSYTGLMEHHNQGGSMPNAPGKMNEHEFAGALRGFRIQRQDKDTDRNPDLTWKSISASALYRGLVDNVRDIGLAVVTLKEGATYFGVFANYGSCRITMRR